jgi:hypothetical protein
MNKLNKIGVLVLFVVGVLVSTGLASASDAENVGCDLKLEAFNNNDFEAWADMMQGKGVLRFVNEDNFETFSKAHAAKLNGDYELAKNLRQEIGLNNGAAKKDGTGFAKLNGYGLNQMNGQNHGNIKLHKNK